MSKIDWLLSKYKYIHSVYFDPFYYRNVPFHYSQRLELCCCGLAVAYDQNDWVFCMAQQCGRFCFELYPRYENNKKEKPTIESTKHFFLAIEQTPIANTLLSLFQRFTNFIRLIRTVTQVLRFVRNVKVRDDLPRSYGNCLELCCCGMTAAHSQNQLFYVT